MINHSKSFFYAAGLCPYQTVVLWYPDAGIMTAVIIVAILKVGQADMKELKSYCGSKRSFPLSLNLFSTGTLLGS